jgi:ABC-type bacteriocin/lantibiotic exporter with double-glycine peptidase domain
MGKPGKSKTGKSKTTTQPTEAARSTAAASDDREDRDDQERDEENRPAAAQPLHLRFPSLLRLGLSQKRQVPFIQQLTDTECGLACLAMILGYHGREVSLEQMRDVCGAARDGLSARDIVEASSLLGLRGRGVKVEVDQLELLPPGSTILHWEFAHFVVFAGLSKGHVDIVDPAVGRRRIPMEEFGRAFTGIALTFETTDLFVRQKRKGAVWPALKQLVLQSGLLRRIMVMSLVLQLFGLAVPVLTGQLIDRILPRADLNLLVVMLSGLAVMVGFRALAEVVRGHLLMHLRTLLDARLTLGFLDHMVSLPYSFFQLRSAGDLMMRLNSNTVVREQLTSTAMSGALDGLMVVVYLVVLMFGSPRLAIAALLAGALDITIFLLVRRRQRELTTRELAVEAKSHGYEVEMLTAMETLKATGSEQRAVSHWSNLFVDQLNVKLQRDRLSIKTDAVVGALRLAGPLAILAVGALEVMAGRLSLGGMLALAAVADSFLEPLANLVHTLLSLETVRGYIERVNDVLAAEPEQASGLRVAPRLRGDVALERVSFRYGPQSPPVVADVSLRVEPGQFVALVGRSGSGKTTLAHLLLGLHRPQSGRVLVDGIDLAELDVRSVRRQFGVVNQNLSLFGTTIRENIAMGDPGVTMNDVEAAARMACVHDDIMGFPMGYNTLLLDRGGAVSGGQRQRLALARALARKPAILLMDEATSALDAATERDVQASLQGLRCTRIVIAHRLSTVRRADVILVLDAGQIVESGTHAELLEQGGVYAGLVAAQLEDDGDGTNAAPSKAKARSR